MANCVQDRNILHIESDFRIIDLTIINLMVGIA